MSFGTKSEQRINLKFLIELGKNNHDAFNMLKKVYGDRCLSRANVYKYCDDYRNYVELQCTDGSDEKTDPMDIDNEKNAASSSNTYRDRSKSVIDSTISGYRKYSSFLQTTRTRSKSLSITQSATDYFTSTEYITQYVDNIPGTSKQSKEIKKSDTIDAKANNISLKVNESACTSKEPIAYASVSKDADCYNMNHKNRGKCIIFNHEQFDLGYDKREGSSLDAKRLEVTFGNLGFDVEVCDDFTHKKIIDKIDEVSQLDHTDNDCLCIIMLTHGVQNDLICARDVIYKSDRLWKPFAADKCITLAGKPKLFFFQACRGDESDSGIVLAQRSLQPETLQTVTETDSVISYAIPTYADFLIAHSSIQGFFTWRNPSEGTWYIQCLCDILDQYGTTMDLMNILTRTARKVATDFSSVNTDNLTLHNKKQAPSVTTMLIRTVYFPPKSNK